MSRRRTGVDAAGPSRLLLKGIEQHLGVLRRFDLGENGFENTVRPDDERGALSAHVLFSVHAFFHPDSVGLDDFLGFVAKKREWQGKLVDEFPVALGWVDADAEDSGLGLKIGPDVPQSAGLSGAARCVVLGVEVEDDMLAGEIGEADCGAVAIGAAHCNGLK